MQLDAVAKEVIRGAIGAVRPTTQASVGNRPTAIAVVNLQVEAGAVRGDLVIVAVQHVPQLNVESTLQAGACIANGDGKGDNVAGVHAADVGVNGGGIQPRGVDRAAPARAVARVVKRHPRRPHIGAEMGIGVARPHNAFLARQNRLGQFDLHDAVGRTVGSIGAAFISMRLIGKEKAIGKRICGDHNREEQIYRGALVARVVVIGVINRNAVGCCIAHHNGFLRGGRVVLGSRQIPRPVVQTVSHVLVERIRRPQRHHAGRGNAARSRETPRRACSPILIGVIHMENRQGKIIIKGKVFYIRRRQRVGQAVRYLVAGLDDDIAIGVRGQGGAAVDGINRFRQLAAANGKPCRGVVRHRGTCRCKIDGIQQPRRNGGLVVEFVTLVHAGVAGRVIVGKLILNLGTEDNVAFRLAVIIGTTVRRIATVDRIHATAHQATIGIQRAIDDFLRDAKHQFGAARRYAAIRRRTLATRAAGIVAEDVIVAAAKARCWRERVGIAVDFQRGRERGVKMLPVGERVGHHHLVESKEVGNLEIKGVFHDILRRIGGISDVAHRFLNLKGLLQHPERPHGDAFRCIAITGVFRCPGSGDGGRIVGILGNAGVGVNGWVAVGVQPRDVVINFNGDIVAIHAGDIIEGNIKSSPRG